MRVFVGLTPDNKRLARLAAGARRSADVRILRGSHCAPSLNPDGSVRVGQHFWWGFLVPSSFGVDGFAIAIDNWSRGQGTFYTSRGDACDRPGRLDVRRRGRK